MPDLDGNDSFWDEVGGQRTDPPPRPRTAPDPLALYRRDPREVSNRPHEWADEIRAANGWPPPSPGHGRSAEDTRGRAARQVAEARAARTVLP